MGQLLQWASYSATPWDQLSLGSSPAPGSIPGSRQLFLSPVWRARLHLLARWQGAGQNSHRVLGRVGGCWEWEEAGSREEDQAVEHYVSEPTCLQSQL